MRSLDVCKKCKWFKRDGRIMTCNQELLTGPEHTKWFDDRFYYEEEFVERKLHPDCIFKMEQIVTLGAEGITAD